MMGKSAILALTVCFAGVFACSAEADRLKEKSLLRDGFILKGTEGTLSCPGPDNGYFFVFDSDISDGKGTIKAGKPVELLPSSWLEKLIADAVGRRSKTYRLWATVTRYEQVNYIFPTYFLAIGSAEEDKPSNADEPQQQPAEQQKQKQLSLNEPNQQTQEEQTDMVVNDPNDTLAIPDEIMAKLKIRKIIQPSRPKAQPKSTKQFQPAAESVDAVLDSMITAEYNSDRDISPARTKKDPELKQDSVIADRTGFIVKKKIKKPRRADDTGDSTADYDLFAFDGLGWKVQLGKTEIFSLLPCRILERAQRKQASELERIRFNVAGIVTQYNGSYYLLLQRAAKVYSHGNFDY